MNAPLQGDLFAPAVEPGPDVTEDSDSWCTPQEIVDIAHRMWPDGIDLDPCSNSHAIALGYIRARVAWTKADDCLVQPTWAVGKRTTCWWQPPYSQEGGRLTGAPERATLKPAKGSWATRWDAGELWETLALVRLDPSTAWWKALDSRACALVHFHDRLAHVENGKPVVGSPFNSAMLFMTRASDPKVRHRALVAAVGDLGHVYH
jgi:hypothetical protein